MLGAGMVSLQEFTEVVKSLNYATYEMRDGLTICFTAGTTHMSSISLSFERMVSTQFLKLNFTLRIEVSGACIYSISKCVFKLRVRVDPLPLQPFSDMPCIRNALRT